MRIFKVMLRFLVSGSGFRYVVSAVLSWVLDNGLYLLLLSMLGMRFASAAVASTAAQIPAGPAPATTTSYLYIFCSFH